MHARRALCCRLVGPYRTPAELDMMFDRLLLWPLKSSEAGHRDVSLTAHIDSVHLRADNYFQTNKLCSQRTNPQWIACEHMSFELDVSHMATKYPLFTTKTASRAWRSQTYPRSKGGKFPNDRHAALAFSMTHTHSRVSIFLVLLTARSDEFNEMYIERNNIYCNYNY